jgi:nitric oxide reductase NorQ protein
VPEPTAAALVELAGRIRRLDAHGLTEVPSTRLLVSTARLIGGGILPREACRAGLVAPLTDDPELLSAMEALVGASF